MERLERLGFEAKKKEGCQERLQLFWSCICIVIEQKRQLIYFSSLHSKFQYILILLFQKILMSIIVRPIQGALIRDTDFFTKMDPFCKVYLGGQCQQTNVCHQGGQSPAWGSTLTFPNNGDMNLRIEVWDYDQIGNNDLIGIGNLNIMSAMQQGGGNSVWVDLFYNGRNAGRVCLSIQMGNNMNMGMGMGMGMGMNQGMGMGMNQGMGMGVGFGGNGGFNNGGFNNGGFGPNPNGFGPPNNGWGNW